MPWLQPPPIGLKSIQNSSFLVFLWPIFAPKMKTTPQQDCGAEVVNDLLLFGQKNGVFFGSSPKVGQEKGLNFGEDFSFFFEIT